MIEEWKDIPGYEELYQVSNIGKCCRGERNHAGGYKWEYIE